jgi:hypothetical protein
MVDVCRECDADEPTIMRAKIAALEAALIATANSAAAAWSAGFKVGTERVTELQADNTRHVDETRAWKERATASRELLTAVLVDFPLTTILSRLATDYDPSMIKRVEQVHARNELLAKDAWCGAANLAREFVKDVVTCYGPLDQDDTTNGPSTSALLAWARRFADATR